MIRNKERLMFLLTLIHYHTIGYNCHACSRSPSLALKSPRVPSITHSCHHHSAHLPSPRHAHQRSLDSPGLNHLCHYLPLFCLVPRSVPDCHLSLFTHVLTMFLFCYLSVPEYMLNPRTCSSSPASVITTIAAH
jgi:hypothetical protein